MTTDCNYKDKNKDFSKKVNYVTGYSNFVRSFVENRNNYCLTDIKNPTIAETENPFTMLGLLTAIINDLNDLRQKIEWLENYLISRNSGNFMVKEKNSEK
jgi:hypothetical protein